ncbi:MAG: ribosome-associated translation inhibitor RaiA [Ignavibacteria bacterium]|nr:ribosome-associated translation inhibitor RaiA [Ignavibacteria bacterium]
MIKTNITARHFKANETLREHIQSNLDNLSKFNEEILHADIILSFEKTVNSIKHCEISVKLRDKVLISKDSSDEFSKSFDGALTKIETQILKYKDKHKSEKHNIEKEIIKTV